VVTGIHFVKDFKAGLHNVFGGRSTVYEEEVTKARAEAIAEMEARARDMGANAIVGVGVDYEKFEAENSTLMIIASGTESLLSRD